MLGTLKELDPRTVWKNEARDFTPWLAEHIDLLAQELGLDLEITESEGAVGPFAVDLVGRDLGSGQIVVIENQLAPTDHSHLGQLLTYAAGRGAKIVVWISPQFREEHRQALDWLNESTDEDQSFFGVEIKVVRIDDSRPAPMFNVVAQPNEWQKTAGRVRNTVTERGEAYRAFWADYLDKLKERAPGLTKAKKTYPQNWYHIGAGRSGFSYGVAFSSNNQVRVELYIDLGDKEQNKEAFDQLYDQKQGIEQELKEELSWERLDNARASRIAVYTPGTIEAGEQELATLRDWAIANVTKFAAVFGERIQNL